MRTLSLILLFLFAQNALTYAEKARVTYSRYFNAKGETRYQPDGSYSEVLGAIGQSFHVRVDERKPTAENLADVDVILISNPSAEAVKEGPAPNHFDDETIATLTAFVRGGGGLIVMGNQENHNLETEATNRLLGKFGMQFVAEHTDIKSIEIPNEAPVLGGLRWAYYTGNQVALDANHEAKPHALITNDTSVKPLKGERNAAGCLLGMASLGKGHVLAISDAGWISNSVLSGGGIAGVVIDGNHNLEIFKRLLFWIGHVQPSHTGDAFAKGAKAVKLRDKGAGEGPAWHPEIGLLTSGHGGIVLHDLAGNESSTYRKDAGTNGLLFDRNSRLLMCEPKRKQVTRLSSDGTYEVLTDSFEGKPYATPNDITFDAQGRIYFSDPRYGNRDDIEQRDAEGRAIEGVYRIEGDGKVSRVITHEVDRPNGVLVSRDQRYLYVADNNNDTIGGAHKLWRFNLNDDGTVDLASQGLVFDWGSARGPDGLVEDARGYLYVAAGRDQAKPPNETKTFYGGGIYVFNSQGEFIDFVAIPNDEVTNCTLGGEELKTLFITAGGTLWSIETPVGAKR